MFCIIFRSREDVLVNTISNIQQEVTPMRNMTINPHYLGYEGSDEDSEPKEECHDPPPRPIACEAQPAYSVIPSSLLENQNVIGEGAFGKVYLALLRSNSPDVPTKLVAVRMNLMSTYCTADCRYLSVEGESVEIYQPELLQGFPSRGRRTRFTESR